MLYFSHLVMLDYLDYKLVRRMMFALARGSVARRFDRNRIGFPIQRH